MSDLQQAVTRLRWFHSIDFGDGIVSQGSIPLAVLLAQADIYFPHSLKGRTFLDIGCWDGFNAIQALRRGAKRVLATDHLHGVRAAGVTVAHSIWHASIWRHQLRLRTSIFRTFRLRVSDVLT
jgi:predicted RNA methylase